MNKPTTYLEGNVGEYLLPSRTRLLFEAALTHGPGFSENIEYRIGRTMCDSFDVLWSAGDWDGGGRQLHASAWLPRHVLKGKSLYLTLLKALFEAEKRGQDAEGPNFDSVSSQKQGLLSSSEVWRIIDEVFHDEDPKRGSS